MTIHHPKVTPQHLGRKAVVYLRQSSPKQVHENLQSQRLQYALRDRAITLGFGEVEIIDDDLGTSAALGAKVRNGFTQLLGSVALGEVGMVLSIEVARLSRTDKDWCHLLELCQVFGTLIADADHIYDLAAMDDQLVLGIKGTLSVVELKVLKSRLLRGQEEKARRGELFRMVAPGYRCDGGDRVVKDPDLRVQTAIQLVFTKFRETWSGRQTHLWFIANQVSLPVNRCGNGKVSIEWQLPRLTFIGSILKTPIYAGAYVYGQRPTKMVVSEGRIVKRTAPVLPPEECRVFIRDHHEGYISWEEFEENRRRLRSNEVRFGSDESVAVFRRGHVRVAGELERRWNERLQEVAQAKKTLEEIANQRRTLTGEQTQQLLEMGRRFRQVWHSDTCPMELKKKIIRTVIEEIVVQPDESTQMLQFIIHWKGGCHTEFQMEKPRCPVGKATELEDVELIRKMADRYDDGEIARVLNKLNRRTGKGMSWSQSRVADARRKRGIAGGRPSKERGQEILSLAQAASYCRVSDTTIRRLVEAKLLPMTQAAPWAPWEIHRADLDAEPVRGIIEHLHKTGTLVMKGIVSENQPELFLENQ